MIFKLELTPRQREVLDFVRRYTAEHGYAPGLRDIGEALGIGSTNGVNDLLKILERKGFIRRTKRIARSIVVVASAEPTPSKMGTDERACSDPQGGG